MTALLEMRGVSASLARAPILRDLSLAVAPGEFVALIGPNGAGKTTLLRCLAGLVRPDAGSVRIAGAPPGRGAGRPRLAYLPQGGGVHWDMPVRDIVALGRAGFGASGDPAVQAALDACRLADLAGRSAASLSGGELARVLLARALAVEAPVFLADEPAAFLDPAHQAEIMRLLVGLARQGTAIVSVFHDLGAALTHASRIVLLKEGRILADGPPDAFLDGARLSEAFGTGFTILRQDGVTLAAPRSAP